MFVSFRFINWVLVKFIYFISACLVINFSCCHWYGELKIFKRILHVEFSVLRRGKSAELSRIIAVQATGDRTQTDSDLRRSCVGSRVRRASDEAEVANRTGRRRRPLTTDIERAPTDELNVSTRTTSWTNCQHTHTHTHTHTHGCWVNYADLEMEPGQDFWPATRPDPIRSPNDVQSRNVVTSQEQPARK